MTVSYGPQHPQVAALVERAERLTGDETRRLAAAWATDTTRIADATRYARAAWAAAWDAAWDAARAAAGKAARSAAWAAARDVRYTTRYTTRYTRAAAGAAALALATRHLIGQGSYTAEHYAILTHPWRRVIGPVHPDDDILLAEHTHGETP